MIVFNKTRNTILAEHAEIADTAFQRMKGLLGRPCLASASALILKPGNSVHTFFMKFPIDVLFVDNLGSVVKAVSDMKPFRLTPIYFSAKLIVEFPAGVIAATSTRKGDIIEFTQ